MGKNTDIKARRSRWAAPDARPDTRNVNDSERDIGIYKLLDCERRYTYLFSNWIAHLLGAHGKHKKNGVSSRLGQLCLAPHYRLSRPEQQKFSLNISYKHNVFTLEPAGYKALTDRGIRNDIPLRPREHYAHTLLTDHINASIEIGCMPHHEFLNFFQLCALGIIPEETSSEKNPFKIAVGEDHVVPDGRPFAIKQDKKVRFVLGMEVDRNTETLIGKHKNSIQRKFIRYGQLFKERGYKSHYGFSNSLVLFITTNETHLKNVMEVARKELGSPSWLLFTTIEDWSTAPHAPVPGPFMFEREWLRVGHPPLKLGDF